MIECRSQHASVSMGNKLFVNGARSYEVFDSFPRKFTLLKAKLPELHPRSAFKHQAVCIGNIYYC